MFVVQPETTVGTEYVGVMALSYNYDGEWLSLLLWLTALRPGGLGEDWRRSIPSRRRSPHHLANRRRRSTTSPWSMNRDGVAVNPTITPATSFFSPPSSSSFRCRCHDPRLRDGPHTSDAAMHDHRAAVVCQLPQTHNGMTGGYIAFTLVDTCRRHSKQHSSVSKKDDP